MEGDPMEIKQEMLSENEKINSAAFFLDIGNEEICSSCGKENVRTEIMGTQINLC